MHTLDHNAVLHTKMMDPFSIIQGFEVRQLSLGFYLRFRPMVETKKVDVRL